jgi:DNA-binding GntR family transcriptional regulator
MTIVPCVASAPPTGDLAERVSRVAAPLRERVLEVLQEEILELRLRPGQRLVERELVGRLGVSRTTVREVLRQLAAEGLVTTIPQKGAIVAIPSRRDAAEVYEVRAVLEGLAARRFAERAGPEEVRGLRAAFAAIEEAQRTSAEPLVLLRAKTQFYDALLAGAGNAIARTLLEGLQARVAMLRAATLASPGRPERSLEEIRAIVEAIEAGDPAEAEAASAHHIERAQRTLAESAASAEDFTLEQIPTDGGPQK